MIQEFIAFFVENIYLQPPVTVKAEHVSFADNFVCLGSAIGTRGRSFLEITIDANEQRHP